MRPHLDAVWLLSELQTVNLYLTSCFFQLGGPHSVIVAEWLLSSSVLCRMGFAILLGKLFLWQRQHFAEVWSVWCRCRYLLTEDHLISQFLSLAKSSQHINQCMMLSFFFNYILNI